MAMSAEDRGQVEATLYWALNEQQALLAELAYVDAALVQEGFPAEEIRLETYQPPK